VTTDTRTPKPEKQKYTRPRLSIHGSLEVITQSNSGSGMMDNGTGGMKTS
jgi:hypothetical protein